MSILGLNSTLSKNSQSLFVSWHKQIHYPLNAEFICAFFVDM